MSRTFSQTTLTNPLVCHTSMPSAINDTNLYMPLNNVASNVPHSAYSTANENTQMRTNVYGNQGFHFFQGAQEATSN